MKQNIPGFLSVYLPWKKQNTKMLPVEKILLWLHITGEPDNCLFQITYIKKKKKKFLEPSQIQKKSEIKKPNK